MTRQIVTLCGLFACLATSAGAQTAPPDQAIKPFDRAALRMEWKCAAAASPGMHHFALEFRTNGQSVLSRTTINPAVSPRVPVAGSTEIGAWTVIGPSVRLELEGYSWVRSGDTRTKTGTSKATYVGTLRHGPYAHFLDLRNESTGEIRTFVSYK